LLVLVVLVLSASSRNDSGDTSAIHHGVSVTNVICKTGCFSSDFGQHREIKPCRQEENLIFKWRFVTNSEQALKIHNARAGTAYNAWKETYALSCVPDKGRRVFGFCNGALH